MENENIVTIQFKFTRDKALILMALFFLCWHPRPLNSETLTLTTYYPAPYGGYASLLTTGRTLLARDGGSVGVGVAAPGQKLDVSGNIRANGETIGTMASGFGQFRAIAGNYGSFIRNDGSDTYMPLITDAGNQYGIWNGLRPLRVNNVSGDVWMANAQVVFRHGTGAVEGLCRVVGYTFGGVTNCNANERIFGWYGDGTVHMWGWVPYVGAWVGQDQSNVTSGNIVGFGQDWSGNMQCCKIR